MPVMQGPVAFILVTGQGSDIRLVSCALQIHYEDFRNFSESFGMQLDDDSLLALYFVHDPEGRYAHLVAV